MAVLFRGRLAVFDVSYPRNGVFRVSMTSAALRLDTDALKNVFRRPEQKEKYYRSSVWDGDSEEKEQGPSNYDKSGPFHCENSPSRRQTASVRLSASDSIIEDMANRNSSGDPRVSVNEDLRMSCESTHSAHSHHNQPIFGEIEEPMTTYDNIHLFLNLEASMIIPLALR